MSVSYVVPVQVVVDTETGKVERVVVIDELCAPSPDDHCAVYETDVVLSSDDPEVVKAYEIAEGQHGLVIDEGTLGWPTWEHGF